MQFDIAKDSARCKSRRYRQLHRPRKNIVQNLALWLFLSGLPDIIRVDMDKNETTRRQERKATTMYKPMRNRDGKWLCAGYCGGGVWMDCGPAPRDTRQEAAKDCKHARRNEAAQFADPNNYRV